MIPWYPTQTLCLFWSVHLLPLFKSSILLDNLATKIPCSGSLLSEQSLEQNIISNNSSPLLSHHKAPHIETRCPTTQRFLCATTGGVLVLSFRRKAFRLHLSQFPWRAKSNPVGCLLLGVPIRELWRHKKPLMSSPLRSDHLFWNSAVYSLRIWAGTFSLYPPLTHLPNPTVFMGATIAVLNHVLWLCWP